MPSPSEITGINKKENTKGEKILDKCAELSFKSYKKNIKEEKKWSMLPFKSYVNISLGVRARFDLIQRPDSQYFSNTFQNNWRF